MAGDQNAQGRSEAVRRGNEAAVQVLLSGLILAADDASG
jgi:hypothetical protein